MENSDRESKKQKSDIEREGKKQKSNHEDGDGDGQLGNSIQALSPDVILDIVSRLPVKSIVQFRFVCKSFYKLSHDSNLVHMNLYRALKSNLYLIFHCDYPLNNHLYFLECPHHEENEEIRIRKFQTPFSDSMPEFNIIGSCNGLLCLVNSLFDGMVCIYNPFTRQYKELPRSVEFEHQIVMYGFGFHPITKEYKVIKITYYKNTYNSPSCSNRFIIRTGIRIRSEVQVFSLGGENWRCIGEIPYLLDRKSTAALVNGRLHWVCKYSLNQAGRNAKRIISFDISDELFREVSTPDSVGRAYPNGYHLAMLRGCLSIAMPPLDTYRGLDVWIMNEYDVKESWVKRFVIEPYTPKQMSPELRDSCGIWKKVLWKRLCVRVVCLLDNGEILLEYKGGTLAAYNPESGTFKDLAFLGMPRLFQTIVHVGSLNWIG